MMLLIISQDRYKDRPAIIWQLVKILQTHNRELTPIQDVYNQVAHLLVVAPDLVKDFEKFLPEFAAQANDKRRKRAGYDTTDDED